MFHVHKLIKVANEYRSSKTVVTKRDGRAEAALFCVIC